MRVRDSDFVVLHHLRNNGRLQHSKLARELGWPISTTQERVQRCLDKFVTRAVALIDLERLGYPNKTLWIVTPAPAGRQRWEERVSSLMCVNTFCRLHHGEFLVESITKDDTEQDALRKALSTNATILGTHPIISHITQEKFLASAGSVPATDDAAGNAADAPGSHP